MSLMTMNRVIKKYGVIIIGSLALIMIFGVVLSSFGNYMTPGGGPVGSGGTSGADRRETPVATVGDQPVTRAMLDTQVENALNQQQQMAMSGMPPPNPSAFERARISYQALTAVQQQQALVAAATKAGITVTPQDIDAEREKVWQQQRVQYGQMLGLTEKATDQEIERELVKQQPGATKQALLASLPESSLRLQVFRNKWIESLKKASPVKEADVRRSYNEIQVRHILIDFGTGKLPEAQAKVKAQKLLDQIKANPSVMASLANQYSDDPGNTNGKTGKKNGGFYDWQGVTAADPRTGQRQYTYVREFAEAALAAGVGKVYPDLVRVVQSNYSGFHIVKLEGERPGKDLPKDFDKNKQQYLDEYAERQVQGVAQAAVTAEVPNVKISVTDPLLHTFQLMDEAQKANVPADQNAKYKLALAELAKVKESDDPQGIVPQTRAAIYTALKDNKQTIAALNEAVKFGNTSETRIALAQAYLDDKNPAEAAKQLDEAEKLAIPDIQLQFRLSQMWQQTGDKARAEAAQKKASEMLQRMAQQSQPAALPPAPVKAPKSVPASSPAPGATPAAK